LVDELAPESLRSKVQRLFLVKVISYDWNCPQYITPRFTAAEMEKHAAPLKARIAELEALLASQICSSAMGPTFRSIPSSKPSSGSINHRL
jgi:hypothetical protein